MASISSVLTSRSTKRIKEQTSTSTYLNTKSPFWASLRFVGESIIFLSEFTVSGLAFNVPAALSFV